MTASSWDKLLLRLQSVAYQECRGRGVAVVSVRLVLADGELRSWTQPRVSYTEPKDGQSRDALVDLIAAID